MSSVTDEKRLSDDDWAEFERQRPAKRAASKVAFSTRVALEFLGALILVSLWTSTAHYDFTSWLQTGTSWVTETARGCHSRSLAGGANDTFDWESVCGTGAHAYVAQSCLTNAVVVYRSSLRMS